MRCHVRGDRKEGDGGGDNRNIQFAHFPNSGGSCWCEGKRSVSLTGHPVSTLKGGGRGERKRGERGERSSLICRERGEGEVERGRLGRSFSLSFTTHITSRSGGKKGRGEGDSSVVLILFSFSGAVDRLVRRGEEREGKSSAGLGSSATVIRSGLRVREREKGRKGEEGIAGGDPCPTLSCAAPAIPSGGRGEKGRGGQLHSASVSKNRGKRGGEGPCSLRVAVFSFRRKKKALNPDLLGMTVWITPARGERAGGKKEKREKREKNIGFF